MTSTMEITETLQDGLIKALETTQRLTLEAVGAGMSSLKQVLPSIPAVPFAPNVVTPEEAISSTLRFAELCFESQKSFITELVGLTEPVFAATKSAKD
jgi:hypothetical protein